MLCRRVFMFALHILFFNHPSTPEIYTLSLHDALPIWSATRTWTSTTHRWRSPSTAGRCVPCCASSDSTDSRGGSTTSRSEEHTSELQSRENLVCRLLLEKKKKNKTTD